MALCAAWLASYDNGSRTEQNDRLFLPRPSWFQQRWLSVGAPFPTRSGHAQRSSNLQLEGVAILRAGVAFEGQLGMFSDEENLLFE